MPPYGMNVLYGYLGDFISISASSDCRLNFILRFWNHVLTCMSDNFSFSASSPLSAEDKYFFS